MKLPQSAGRPAQAWRGPSSVLPTPCWAVPLRFIGTQHGPSGPPKRPNPSQVGLDGNHTNTRIPNRPLAWPLLSCCWLIFFVRSLRDAPARSGECNTSVPFSLVRAVTLGRRGAMDVSCRADGPPLGIIPPPTAQRPSTNSDHPPVNPPANPPARPSRLAATAHVGDFALMQVLRAEGTPLGKPVARPFAACIACCSDQFRASPPFPPMFVAQHTEASSRVKARASNTKVATRAPFISHQMKRKQQSVKTPSSASPALIAQVRVSIESSPSSLCPFRVRLPKPHFRSNSRPKRRRRLCGPPCVCFFRTKRPAQKINDGTKRARPIALR